MSKVPLISDLLIHKNQMFFALSETWLKDEKDAEIGIPGYQVFGTDKNASKKKYIIEIPEKGYYTSKP